MSWREMFRGSPRKGDGSVVKDRCSAGQKGKYIKNGL
jgi:hypothetical protein